YTARHVPPKCHEAPGQTKPPRLRQPLRVAFAFGPRGRLLRRRVADEPALDGKSIGPQGESQTGLQPSSFLLRSGRLQSQEFARTTPVNAREPPAGATRTCG